MDISWAGIKEVFFALGAIAGFLALLKPVFQQKYDLDRDRIRSLMEKMPESLFSNLQYSTWSSRSIRAGLFDPLDHLCFDVKKKSDSVRFSGPLSSWYAQEINELVSLYKSFREYVQVPEWEPIIKDLEGEEETYWVFNKQAYETDSGDYDKYAHDLSSATKLAEKMHLQIQRLQIISELHLIEAPISRFLLPKRFLALEEAELNQ